MVTHCLCYDLSFEHLRALAREHHLTFEELQTRTKCSTGCTMCEPYVRLMLKTGRTSLPVLSPAQVDQILKEAREAPSGEDPSSAD